MMKVILLFIFFLFITALFSQVPDYEFITEPTEIMMNYFDYMPGSYCGIPIQVQPEISQPNGYPAGGVYIVFHARETAQATRREYWVYFDAEGNLIDCATIGITDFHEGYAGIDIDPVTGDPFVVWHADVVPATVDLEVVGTYDLFHEFGTPGNWREHFTVINDTIPSPNMPMDEFIWPYVHIGPSPDLEKRRVYVIANNNFSPIGTPSENVLICHADFDEEDLTNQSTLDWTYNTIPLLDEWNQSIPEWIRPHLSMCVSDDGRVALIGYTNREEGTDSLVVFLNTNFGTGDFDYYSTDAHFEVWDPWNGTDLLYFTPYLCNHQNSLFYDENTKISFLGNMNLMIEGGSWYPDLNLMYPKVYTFDLQTQEFSFYDLYLEGADPSDNSPMIPWDYNEDGIVDSLGPNGEILYVEGWPIYNYDSDMAYHENNFKITKNEEKGWLTVVWGDGLKCRKAYQGVLGYAQWEDNPEIAICVSGDNGVSWSQPIFLNALETPELADMIPVYVYPGDKIEDLDNNHGKLHLFFLNDYEYGPYGQGGINPGGMQIYCALDIDFGPFVSIEDKTVPQFSYELYNYPNPFNPETTISFSVTQTSSFVTLEIYNIKGQKVKTLVNEVLPAGKYSTIWNGRDSNGNRVSSGIYFYKLCLHHDSSGKAGDYQKVKKMILLK
ncbi:MAG: T9SS type A sorting domain-containing protein [Candidatus Cloacimonetes bacterium]|nr:T9SS type A sorting domain-containing protein [Candidatus Cloacimonadota bacterium]